ncbi:HTTM domain-containing protein [Oceanisphaera sp.]|uniref:HTTM domain-containing protein n=1 Tax=Oceanisphaera sp. TaxID=1929979 RepID=UPI003A8ECCFC
MINPRQSLDRFTNRLFDPVDASSLAFFRICFGIVMLIECWRFYSNDWIYLYYIAPDFRFTYYGFEWVAPLPGNGMYWLFGAMALLSLCIALGLFYRVTILLLWLSFTYIFLLDQARYLNHFYLVSLLLFLLALMPAHRTVSIDAWLSSGRQGVTVSRWSIWMLRAQMEVMLIYAGLVKINPDWLRLEPLGMWLARRTDTPLIGPLLEQDWFVAVASYGVIAVHLIGAPLLLFRRTRLPIIIVYFAFHLSNHFMFSIGIFPWLTMAATLLFLDPDWPKQMLRSMSRLAGRHNARVPDPDVGNMNHRDAYMSPRRSFSPRARRALLTFIVVWFGFQILFPLRHLLYPGNPSWTEEGHRFAWMMKLRDKKADIEFTVRDPVTGREWRVEPSDLLLYHQAVQVGSRPDLILQLAHHIENVWANEFGLANVEVRARTCVSLNGRPAALLIDSGRDLTKIERGIGHADWILPLRMPFERPPNRTHRHDLGC